MGDTKKDVTKELKPTEVVANLCLQALGGGYMDWVPEWAHETHKDKYHPIIFILEQCGITDAVIGAIPAYKEMIESL